MSKPEQARRMSIAALAGAAHVWAYFQFRLCSEVPLLPAWGKQAGFLLLTSLVLTLSQPAVREAGLLLAMLCVRAGILLLFGYPLGPYMGMEATLFTALAVEAVGCFGIKTGMAFAIPLAILLVSLQRPVMAWGVLLPGPTPYQLLEFCLQIVLAMAAIVIVRYFYDERIRLAHDNRQLDESVIPLARANMGLQEYAITAGQQAVAIERKRLAREMHDTTAYSLTNLIMMLEAAMDLAPQDTEVLLRHLELARDQAKAGLLEVRRAVQELRSADLAEPAGLKAVQFLVEAFEKVTQVHVDLTIYAGVPESLGEEADLTAFRLVQEGLTNALRHGRATKIVVTFARLGQAVSVQIKDNGVGVSSVKEGYGLTGMRERVARLGGQLQIFSESGLGFLLSVCIPLEEG